MNHFLNNRQIAVQGLLLGGLVLLGGFLSGCGAGMTQNPKTEIPVHANQCGFFFKPYEWVGLEGDEGIVAVGIGELAQSSRGKAKLMAEQWAVESIRTQLIAESELLIQEGSKIAKDLKHDDVFGQLSREIIMDKYIPKTVLYGAQIREFCTYPDLANAEEVWALAVLNLSTMQFTNEVLDIMKSIAGNEELVKALDQNHDRMMEKIKQRRLEYQREQEASAS